MRTDFLRTRWAALGAAVAVSLGAGGIGLVNAETSSGAMPVYIAINPCRLADTRPEFQVGPRSTSIGPNEEWTLTGWGAAGNCTLPANTSALALNVTAVGATAPTFLQLFPGDGTRPSVGSNLNPGPGQPPTPNAVLVDLSDADGTFKLFNAFGAVNVIVDVVGYYDDHVHTGADIVDETLTGADVQDSTLTGADVQDSTITKADIADESGVAFTQNLPGVNVGGGSTIISSVSIRPPRAGYVTVTATAYWQGTAAQGVIACEILDDAGTITATVPRIIDSSAFANYAQPISLTNTYPVDQYAGLLLFGGHPFNLVCLNAGAGSTTISNVQMTATYHSTSYAPFVPIIVL